MDEGVKQVIIVAIAVVVGLALIALFAKNGEIMTAIGGAIKDMVEQVTGSVSGG